MSIKRDLYAIDFAHQDLQQLAPEVPRGQCQVVLRKLRKMGEVRMVGATSSARWFLKED